MQFIDLTVMNFGNIKGLNPCSTYTLEELENQFGIDPSEKIVGNVYEGATDFFCGEKNLAREDDLNNQLSKIKLIFKSHSKYCSILDKSIETELPIRLFRRMESNVNRFRFEGLYKADICCNQNQNQVYFLVPEKENDEDEGNDEDQEDQEDEEEENNQNIFKSRLPSITTLTTNISNSQSTIRAKFFENVFDSKNKKRLFENTNKSPTIKDYFSTAKKNLPPNNNISPIKKKILIDLDEKSPLASPKPSTEEKEVHTTKKIEKRKKNGDESEKEQHDSPKKQKTTNDRTNISKETDITEKKNMAGKESQKKKKIVEKKRNWNDFFSRDTQSVQNDKVRRLKCFVCNLSFDVDKFDLHLFNHRSKLIEEDFHQAIMLQQATTRSIIEKLDED